MKNLLTLTLGALMCLAVFTGCNKNHEDVLSPTGHMTATLGGVAFNSHDCYESSLAGDPFYRLTANSDTTSVDISVYSPDGYLHTGSFAISASDSVSHAGYHKNAVFSDAVSGTVTITSVNTGKDFSGTFSFTCADGTVVNGGEFTAVF